MEEMYLKWKRAVPNKVFHPSNVTRLPRILRQDKSVSYKGRDC